MNSIKTFLLAGALAIAGSTAFAQTMAPNIGVNFGSPNDDAYRADAGLNSYASVDRVRPAALVASQAPRSVWQSRAQDIGAGYVTGGGVSLR